MNKTLIKRICLGIILLLSVSGGVIAIYSTINGPGEVATLLLIFP